MHQFLKFIFGIKLYMFRTVPLPNIRTFSLYTQQRYMSHRLQLQLESSIRMERPDPAPDDGQGNCPKHVVLFQK